MSRRRKLWKSVTSGLDLILPTRSISRPATPSPNVLTCPEQPPFSHPDGVRSKANLSGLSTSNIGGKESPAPPPPGLSTLPLTLITAGTTSSIQQATKSKSDQAQTQHASSYISVAEAHASDAAPTSPGHSPSKCGWAWLNTFLRVVGQSASMFGPLKAAVDELIGCIEIFERAANGRDEFRALQIELERLFEGLSQHFSRDAPPTVTASMESLCKSVVKELCYVKEKQGRSITMRYLEAEEDADDILACYRRIQGHLQRLSLNANLSMWKIVDEQATDARLDRLSPPFSACYNSRQAAELKRGACTPGTRVDVLGHMYFWVYDRAAGTVYWLNGMAGTGKTTIAYSLCRELEAAHNLGASFFCSRLLPECRDVNQIVPSLAYQLARFSRPFRSALSRVLEKERDVHTQLLEIQFDMLVTKPLTEVRETLPEDLVVVIDALDECDNKRSTERILESLLTKTSNLPIKFLITSRPEPEIRDQMTVRGGRRDISRLVLHELDKGVVQGDIETYLRAALDRIKPSESDISTLVQRAGILFIYAATVVRYISHNNFGKNPRNRLRNVLNVSSAVGNNPYKDIDELYTLILAAAIDDPGLDDGERFDMTHVLNTVLCAREPLTIGAISGLLGLDDVERVHSALRPLWSVLHVVESSELVTTLHASFPDYMFNPERSKNYFCDPATHDHALTRRCFELIQGVKPKFNICGLESSYVLDDQIPNLKARVEKAISVELAYACQYWATHLERAKESSSLVELLEEFLSTRLLLWMEIMNLKKCMDAGIGVMRQAEEWCVCQVRSEELTQLVHDAWRFVVAFTSNPASQSTPHIYVSMLPFWPDSNPISKYYAKRMTVPTVAHGSAISRRRLEHLATWSVDGEVSGVSWSPDGTRIALASGGHLFIRDAVTGRVVVGPLQKYSSRAQCIGFSPNSALIAAGFEDGTTCIWDAQSGQLMLDPLGGHTSWVTSVAFSPDSTRIISGSGDSTIYMWDARNGRKVLGPLEVHTDSIRSVAFSPDGTRIISGSDDKAIRVWDARNGVSVLGPLKGHKDWVTSVAYSPDSTRIVSGSGDGAILIWDARNGQKLIGPLEGHTNWVTSVAFSPDGTHIISSSDDKTIRLWDAQSGQTVLGPLEGHTDPITSVAFSPDGTRIVSGSSDKTIRMWDARSRHKVLGPLDSHTKPVRSVAFSPDGSHIVSGSDDKTIRIWGTRSGQAIAKPLKGHTSRITSVAFSPDGAHVISGSDDRTIRKWGVESRRTVVNPLKGHTNLVTTVSFSPDGTQIVSGSDDKTIRLWDARSGRIASDPLKGHVGRVTSIAFSPNGAQVVSGSADNTIRIWDVQSGQTVLGPLEGHTDLVRSVTFSPDGTHIASGSDDKTIRTWDVQSGRSAFHPLKGHTGWVTSVAYSADGTRLVSGSADKTIRIWDTQSGQTVLGPLEGHTGLVRSVSFSPDGARIVSGSDDETIRIWDARTAQIAVSSLSSSPIFPPSWGINTDGWVTDHDVESRILVWVPSNLLPLLLPPRNILSISAAESFSLNLIDARIGESWAESYNPH